MKPNSVQNKKPKGYIKGEMNICNIKNIFNITRQPATPQKDLLLEVGKLTLKCSRIMKSPRLRNKLFQKYIDNPSLSNKEQAIDEEINATVRKDGSNGYSLEGIQLRRCKPMKSLRRI